MANIFAIISLLRMYSTISLRLYMEYYTFLQNSANILTAVNLVCETLDASNAIIILALISQSHNLL